MKERLEALADPELMRRLASLVCDGGEASYDEVRAAFAACIDHTLLDPTAGPERVASWARSQASQGFATLCVQPCNAARVAWELDRLESPTGTCAVLAFPQGQALPEALCFEVALLMEAGVDEFDLVMNYGAFLEGSYDEVAAPIRWEPSTPMSRRTGNVRATMRNAAATATITMAMAGRGLATRRTTTGILRCSRSFWRQACSPRSRSAPRPTSSPRWGSTLSRQAPALARAGRACATCSS